MAKEAAREALQEAFQKRQKEDANPWELLSMALSGKGAIAEELAAGQSLPILKRFEMIWTLMARIKAKSPKRSGKAL